MTQAFNDIMNGNIIKGVIDVFTSTTGDVLFYFLCIAMLAVVVGVSTQSIAYGGLVFVLFSGALVSSHLSQFSVNYGMIPAEFQTLIYIGLLVSFAVLVYYAITRRS